MIPALMALMDFPIVNVRSKIISVKMLVTFLASHQF